MARKSPYQHKTIGYVVVNDMFHAPIEYVDCTAGGAQEALQAMFDKYQRDGWALEGRSMDRQLAHRGSERVMIDITPFDPTKPIEHQHLRF